MIVLQILLFIIGLFLCYVGVLRAAVKVSWTDYNIICYSIIIGTILMMLACWIDKLL